MILSIPPPSPTFMRQHIYEVSATYYGNSLGRSIHPQNQCIKTVDFIINGRNVDLCYTLGFGGGRLQCMKKGYRSFGRNKTFKLQLQPNP